MYKIVNDTKIGLIACIMRTNSDGSITSFGTDQANTDYQEYLKWLAEGNQPLPADGE